MDNSTKICCALALIAIVLSLYSIFTREKYTAGSVYSTSGDGVITVDSSGNLSVNSLTQVQTNQSNISTLDGKVDALKDIGLVTSFTSGNNSTVPTSLAVANYADSVANTAQTNAQTYASGNGYHAVSEEQNITLTTNTGTDSNISYYNKFTNRTVAKANFTITPSAGSVHVINIVNDDSITVRKWVFIQISVKNLSNYTAVTSTSFLYANSSEEITDDYYEGTPGSVLQYAIVEESRNRIIWVLRQTGGNDWNITPARLTIQFLP